MHKLLLFVFSFFYTACLLLLALAIVTVSSGLHAPFTQNTIVDTSLTLYLLTGNEHLLDVLTLGEASHMQDVGRLVSLLFYLVAGLIILVVFVVIYATPEERMTLAVSPLLWIIGLQPLLFFLVRHFDEVFIRFHELFFPQGNWQFAYDSVLISTYPQEFFFAMTIAFIVVFLLLVLSGLLLSYVHGTRRTEW